MRRICSQNDDILPLGVATDVRYVHRLDGSCAVNDAWHSAAPPPGRDEFADALLPPAIRPSASFVNIYSLHSVSVT